MPQARRDLLDAVVIPRLRWLPGQLLVRHLVTAATELGDVLQRRHATSSALFHLRLRVCYTCPMTLDAVQQWVQRVGAVALVVALAAIFLGLARGLPRQRRDGLGWPSRLLRAPLFYAAASVGYFGLCYLIWRPLPWQLSASGRALSLLLGGLLYFPGLALLLWARLTLGRMYFVSSTYEAPLYADHRLITTGPFAIVRHPMYLGLLLTCLGGILIYWTWTFVFAAANFFGLIFRARREEEALAAALGQEWEAYRQRVPAWIPRLHR